jgi:hypothetical protein
VAITENHPYILTHKFYSTISQYNREKERKHERDFWVREKSTRGEIREKEFGPIPCITTMKNISSSQPGEREREQ